MVLMTLSSETHRDSQRVTESHRDRDISTLLETFGDYYRLAMISLLLVNHFLLLFFRNIFMCVWMLLVACRMHSPSAGKLSTQASGSLAFLPLRIEITFSLINRTLFVLANAWGIHEHPQTVSRKGLNSIAEVVCEPFCRHHGALRRGQPQS